MKRSTIANLVRLCVGIILVCLMLYKYVYGGSLIDLVRWGFGGGTAVEAAGDGRPALPPVAADGPAMQAAHAQARASFAAFRALLAADKPTGYAAVKVEVRQGARREGVWLVDIVPGDGPLAGAVDNTPRRLRQVRRGDRFPIDPARVLDWIYIDAEGVYGGFTLPAYRNALPAEARARFDADFPLAQDLAAP